MRGVTDVATASRLGLPFTVRGADEKKYKAVFDEERKHREQTAQLIVQLLIPYISSFTQFLPQFLRLCGLLDSGAPRADAHTTSADMAKLWLRRRMAEHDVAYDETPWVFTTMRDAVASFLMPQSRLVMASIKSVLERPNLVLNVTAGMADGGGAYSEWASAARRNPALQDQALNFLRNAEPSIREYLFMVGGGMRRPQDMVLATVCVPLTMTDTMEAYMDTLRQLDEGLTRDMKHQRGWTSDPHEANGWYPAKHMVTYNMGVYPDCESGFRTRYDSAWNATAHDTPTESAAEQAVPILTLSKTLIPPALFKTLGFASTPELEARLAYELRPAEKMDAAYLKTLSALAPPVRKSSDAILYSHKTPGNATAAAAAIYGAWTPSLSPSSHNAAVQAKKEALAGLLAAKQAAERARVAAEEAAANTRRLEGLERDRIVALRVAVNQEVAQQKRQRETERALERAKKEALALQIAAEQAAEQATRWQKQVSKNELPVVAAQDKEAQRAHAFAAMQAAQQAQESERARAFVEEQVRQVDLELQREHALLDSQTSYHEEETRRARYAFFSRAIIERLDASNAMQAELAAQRAQEFANTQAQQGAQESQRVKAFADAQAAAMALESIHQAESQWRAWHPGQSAISDGQTLSATGSVGTGQPGRPADSYLVGQLAVTSSAILSVVLFVWSACLP